MKSLTAASQRRMPENGGTTARLTKLAKTQRMIKDLQAKLRYLQKEGWTGEQPLKVCGQAAILNEKLERFAGTEREKVGEGAWSCPKFEGEIGSDMHEDYVAQLGKYVDQQSRKESQQVESQRLGARKQELKVDWVTGGESSVTGRRESKGSYPL